MGSTTLPYMKTNPKIIFFTDFDGTITLQDSNDYMTDNLGYGVEKRRAGNLAVLEGRMSFRDSFSDMLASVKTPFNECIRILQEKMKLDPHFVEFYYWAKENNVPIVVLSSGMVPVIQSLFETLLGHKIDSHMYIVANEVESRDGKDINTEGGWQIKFHDESHFGHDKSREIKPYAALPDNERPTLLYAGDGVSDLSAAAETDLLFAKKGHDLVTYCEREGMPFTLFETWESILATTKDIESGKVSIKKVRTAVQLGIITTIVLLLVLLLDNRVKLLPASIHGHLPTHYPGYVVTDVTIASCSSIGLFSKCRLDPERWTRIEKDLYLRTGWTSSAFLHVERKKEEELLPTDKVVVDLKISRLEPTLTDETKADTEVWEQRPGGIWLKRTAQRHASDSQLTITAVDVLFGADAVDPRLNWEVKDRPLMLDSRTEELETRLTIRRGTPPKNKLPVPRINDNGRFKIMQLADLHLSTGLGACRDAVPAELKPGQKCDADPRTLDFVERLLDEEKPDLVVLTGDQVNGETAADAQTALFKSVKLLVDRQIPYAAIFGNHDDEGDLKRAQQMAILEELPYSLSVAGPEEVDGVGNYIVEVLGHGSTTHSALTLYLLDTHSYSPDERQFRGYDWLKPSQIGWFTSTAEGLKKKHREYTHIHMNMAFIHIPLPEYRETNNYYQGSWTEAPTAPGFNSGFMDALEKEDILFVSSGHDHVNDYCMLDKDDNGKPALWMCYGGGVGFGGYGGYGGYVRRVRFFDFDMGPGRVVTYKRLEHGDTEARIDEMMIVDGGAVKAPVGVA
ncbi:hypothetical protein ASPZODRAFT_140231 [Penicilliopsis zonata CBS 506.65]|uniref:Calcineurin-like phosphoesterase domain-containing protein n=1 Tax=Penicilliopsis zonata CBS 506.65 TaxID=1073090 RepID=A0A1L9SQF8_9EURO|nr:hypothetical protein ASPZODRAFT_140231 [Penicilliopsis zonata CBS 506.65]OJJ49323.1 hypothetical protein ASPZODRAFT_140231 [Penicilliopsis zonata CBS 506.65]